MPDYVQAYPSNIKRYSTNYMQDKRIACQRDHYFVDFIIKLCLLFEVSISNSGLEQHVLPKKLRLS